MDWLGTTHLAVALGSLGSGAVVLVMRKGTRRHRLTGRVYVGCMLGVNLTAFMIYDLFGGFGPFHVAAFVSLVTVVAGLVPARRRKPRQVWIAHHAYWMAWSYVGLAAAAVSEVSTRYVGLPFGLVVGGATLVVVAIGWWLIKRRMPGTLGRFGIDVSTGKPLAHSSPAP